MVPLNDIALVPGGAEVVSLREHLETLQAARERNIALQIQNLTASVAAAQAAGTEEHRQVRADIQTLQASQTALATEVQGMKSAAAAVSKLRNLDLAKLGALVSAAGVLAAYLFH